MRGAVLAAVAAAVGNLLQGWDNSTIAGAVLYIKKEFHLETQPTVEGLLMSMAIIGGTIITTCSGPLADIYGRRPMMITSGISYLFGGSFMLWAPNVPILLIGRLLNGCAIGLAVTIVPVYISETAPSEIRGQLNTLPQFMGSGGMFLSYIMVFGMSLMSSPSWRIMLGIIAIPALCYLLLAIFFLPESPPWLVSKGRMNEAKKVLQRLRGVEDVTGELILLVEGLGVSNDEGALVAKPPIEQSTAGGLSTYASIGNQTKSLKDPLVNLFGSVHENAPGMGSRTVFPSMGSLFGIAEEVRNQKWDEENPVDCEENDSPANDNLRSPLLVSHQLSSAEKDVPRSTFGSMRRNSSLVNPSGEEGALSIGGGWQLAYKMPEKEGEGLQKVFFQQDTTGSQRGSILGSQRGSILGSQRGSILSVAGEGELGQAALVSRSVIAAPEILSQAQEAPAAIRPKEVFTGPSWKELLEPGVKRALIVGVGLQILQQISGINGVLYYTPQILSSAGVGVLLANLGLSEASASLLISLLTAFLMLPCIMVSMKLIDVSGRRSLMLFTIPILIVALLALILSSIVHLNSTLQATISTAGVMIYISCFVMGFGAIPNILCAEIFPTRVRGLCITICALTFWLGNMTVTYSLPVLLNYLGLSGLFAIYATACTVSWIFVFLKVPETKGMPLEVIVEFFSVGTNALAKAE